MSTIDQTTRKEDGGNVLTGFLRNTLQTGLGVAETMHQTAVEVPLNMLQVVGVSEEQTSALKDKHRNLLRSMYGSIDSIASQFVDVGENQAAKLSAEIRDRVESSKAAREEEPAEEASVEEERTAEVES
jgi:hypothetical protein